MKFRQTMAESKATPTLSRLVLAAHTKRAQLRFDLPDPGRGVKRLDDAQIESFSCLLRDSSRACYDIVLSCVMMKPAAQ